MIDTPTYKHGIYSISGMEYALYIDGFIVEICKYNDYATIEGWQLELEEMEGLDRDY